MPSNRYRSQAIVAILIGLSAPAAVALDPPPFFLPPVTYTTDHGRLNFGPYTLAAADLNGDGKQDIVLSDGGGIGNIGSVLVFLGKGEGTFRPPVRYDSGGTSADSVFVADVNGDNKPDILVAHCGQTLPSGPDCALEATVSVLLGKGDGTFRAAVSYGSGGFGAIAIAVADVNGDGKADMIVTNGISDVTGPDGSVGVLLGKGDGTFALAEVYDSGGQRASGVAISDVNGDGNPDLLVSNGSGVLGVLQGNGDGSFQPPVLYDEGDPNVFAMAVADVNKDGQLDVVVSSSGSNKIGVLLGNGDGMFKPVVMFASGTGVSWVPVIADVNGDGNLDVVVPHYFDGQVGLLLGNGDGTYQKAIPYSVNGSSASSLAVADFNGDGLPDLVVTECAVTGCDNGNELGVLLHVGPTTTHTTIASALNPSVYGQAVTLRARVTGASGPPKGTMVFLDGSTEIGRATLVSGVASISPSGLSAGPHSVTAVYQGSVKFNSSASPPEQQAVTIATTTTTLAASHNPAILVTSVTYTASVAGNYGGAATGTVDFYDGGVAIKTVAVAGNQATFQSAAYKAAGVHLITAVYRGDGSNTASTSATLTESVLAASKTVLATSGSPSLVGQLVTFTAAVTSRYGAIPNGELVTFSAGKAPIATVALSGGAATCTISSLSATKHEILVSYLGDGTFAPSLGALTQAVNKNPTMTTLTSDPNPSSTGQTVTLTAQVTSGSAGAVVVTGTVKFFVEGNAIGTAKLNGGVAKISRSTFSAGTHAITAAYLGNFAFAVSTTGVVNQIVR